MKLKKVKYIKYPPYPGCKIEWLGKEFEYNNKTWRVIAFVKDRWIAPIDVQDINSGEILCMTMKDVRELFEGYTDPATLALRMFMKKYGYDPTKGE